jgi:hypothetical protein
MDAGVQRHCATVKIDAYEVKENPYDYVRSAT